MSNVTGSQDKVTLYDVNEAASEIQESASEDANIIFGAAYDDTLGDTVRVTVVATRFEGEEEVVGVQQQQPQYQQMAQPQQQMPMTQAQPQQGEPQPQQQPQPMMPKFSIAPPSWLNKH